jgi:hypothetical protein
MASSLARQVGRVRRRMFLGALLAGVAWGWVAALAAASAWFIVGPYLLPGLAGWVRWAVLGGLAGASTVAAVTASFLRRPSAVAAALSLDERFGLKERVTTSLTLAPDEAASPAGAALLADVEQRLAQVRVADRFPVALPWKPAALLPLGALAVALLALFWNPHLGATRPAEGAEGPLAPEGRADVEQELKKLASAPPRKKKAKDDVKEEDLARIEAEVEKFARKPRETRDQVRQRINDAAALEDEIRRRQKERADRVDAFKEQMKQVERLARKKRDKDNEGPAKGAAGAVAQGDMAKAAEEFDRLGKQLEKEEEKERLRRKKQDPKAGDEEKKKATEELEKLERESKLSRREREALKKQLEDLEDDLKRLSRNKDEIAKELKEMAERGEMDKEELERELEQLEKNAEKLNPEEIKELAEALKECKDCLKEGKDGEAARALAKAAKKAGQMGKGGEGGALARKLVQIQRVRQALARSLGQGGPGAGRRPESKDKNDTGVREEFSPAEFDKGKLEVVGHGPAGGFKGPRKPSEMAEEIRQAAQEAPAAIDRQRLPPSARKMARGYFEKVRGADLAPEAKGGKKP